MAKRHFLMLASSYKEGMAIGGWWMSEKFDGSRAFWDGGCTRGMLASTVPWANTESDHLHEQDIVSTGLWSRYGNVIHAPDSFLDQLPPVLLDGELEAGRGNFQKVRSIVSRMEPDARWADIHYRVFSMPSFDDVFADGFINVPNYCKYVRFAECARLRQLVMRVAESGCGFDVERIYLREYWDAHLEVRAKLGLPLVEMTQVSLVEYTRLPCVSTAAHKVVMDALHELCALGGEGLILRHPNWAWKPERVKHMLKIKDLRDAEATVVGYTTGRETDRGSKLLGLMGALVLDFNGVRLELSGFTDAERVLGWAADGGLPAFLVARNGHTVSHDRAPSVWAEQHPGDAVPDWIEATAFPRGSLVTFKYRELSDDGIPKEARYWRKR